MIKKLLLLFLLAGIKTSIQANPQSTKVPVLTNSIKITTFTESGTWTKAPESKYIIVIGWNGGSGGGSGRRGDSTAAAGGDGGGSGGWFYFEAPAIFFGATEIVTVGLGGAGGRPQKTDNSNGKQGHVGGQTSFGNIATALPAHGGDGGSDIDEANGGPYGEGLTTFMLGSAGEPSSAGGGTTLSGNSVAASRTYVAATGGGGGSGADTTQAQAGGNGGDIQNVFFTAILAGGKHGIETGKINGRPGANYLGTGGIITGGTGGGGGGGQHVGDKAGKGGAGGIPGAGGGGGGGSLNGTNSGAGGDGGRGEVQVIEFF